MAKQSFLFFLILFLQHLETHGTSPDSQRTSFLASTAQWQTMQCSAMSINPLCSSFLYVTPQGRTLPEIATIFSANASLIKPIRRLSGVEDFLVGVPCKCEKINDTMTALFHDATYEVKVGDTPGAINVNTFSGLAMDVGGGRLLNASDRIIVHLPCGCSSAAS
ncbi:hypothetical protein ACP70R_046651 [Stipagrostis hirtigluma subsp. patula]